MILAEGPEVLARRAAILATLLQEDLIRLKSDVDLDPTLHDALSALAETQPFQKILPISAKLACANNAALAIFSNPEPKCALEDFTGNDHQFAMVRSGDRVVLYGRDRDEAIVFNERNHSVGRVPFDILGWIRKEANFHVETFTARQNYDGDPSCGYFLSWKVGTRILVCCWEDRKAYRGSGINLSTGKTGRFQILSHNCVVDS